MKSLVFLAALSVSQVGLSSENKYQNENENENELDDEQTEVAKNGTHQYDAQSLEEEIATIKGKIAANESLAESFEKRENLYLQGVFRNKIEELSVKLASKEKLHTHLKAQPNLQDLDARPSSDKLHLPSQNPSFAEPGCFSSFFGVLEIFKDFFSYDCSPHALTSACPDTLTSACSNTLTSGYSKALTSQITKVILPLKNPSIKSKNFLKTIDGKKIYYDYSPPRDESLGVVVLFHGNGFTGENWNPKILDFFKEQGLGVLTPTIRFYSDTSLERDGNINKSILFDTEAVFNFLYRKQNIDPKKIVAFGFSLGGAYATSFAHYFRTPLILQNAWGELAQIADRLGPAWQKIFSEYQSKDYFPNRNYNLRTYEEFGYEFDGLAQDLGSNIRKLEEERYQDDPINVAIVYAWKDKLMEGRRGAHRLFEARYGHETKNKKDPRIIRLNGDHSAYFTKSKEAKKALLRFLRENKITPSMEV